MGNSDVQSTTKCLAIDTFTFLFPCLPHIYIDSDTPQQCQEFIRRYCENLSQCSFWSYYQAYYKEGGLQPFCYEYSMATAVCDAVTWLFCVMFIWRIRTYLTSDNGRD